MTEQVQKRKIRKEITMDEEGGVDFDLQEFIRDVPEGGRRKVVIEIRKSDEDTDVTVKEIKG